LKTIIASWETLNIGVENSMLRDIVVPQTMPNILTINATLKKIISSWITPNKKKTNSILQTMQIQKSTHCMMTQWKVKMKGNSMQGRCEKLWTSEFTFDSL
jgi:hypothetical protein